MTFNATSTEGRGLQGLRGLSRLTLLAATLLLGACASDKGRIYPYPEGAAPPPVPVTQGVYKVGSPYRIKGKLYTPQLDPTYNRRGIASWYGRAFHGKRTANGETYDMTLMTAAHPTLPMPSLVRVTNLENGLSVDLRLNDRGPFAHDRIIDVSAKAAELLGFKRQGTVEVQVTYLGRAPLNFVTPKAVATRGPAPSRLALAPTGPSAVVPGAPGPSLSPPPPRPQPDPSPDDDPLLALIESGLGDGQPAAGPPLAVVPAAPQRAVFVQAGAFLVPDRAYALSRDLASLKPSAPPARVSLLDQGGNPVYRVRFGPFADVNEASRLVSSLQSAGHGAAKIVVE
ncbi:MAG: septal ring lytic transglycosylase RlpA family protein [Pseudomonadota bacterium]